MKIVSIILLSFLLPVLNMSKYHYDVDLEKLATKYDVEHLDESIVISNDKAAIICIPDANGKFVERLAFIQWDKKKINSSENYEFVLFDDKVIAKNKNTNSIKLYMLKGYAVEEDIISELGQIHSVNVNGIGYVNTLDGRISFEEKAIKKSIIGESLHNMANPKKETISLENNSSAGCGCNEGTTACSCTVGNNSCSVTCSSGFYACCETGWTPDCQCKPIGGPIR